MRTQACKLVANDSTCSTTTVVRTDSGTSAAGAAGLDLVTMALWIALIAGLVVLLVVVGRALATRSAKVDDDVEELDDPGVEEVGGVVVDRRREPSNWRAEADAHRRAGRFRDALRCRYRALVGDLARRGLIDEIPGRTTGEERAQLHDVAPRAARRSIGPPTCSTARGTATSRWTRATTTRSSNWTVRCCRRERARRANRCHGAFRALVHPGR